MKLQNKPLRAACVVLTSAMTLILSAQHAQAGIISTTGAALAIENSPVNIVQNQWESNSRARIFQESSGVSFKGDLLVDFVNPGVYRDRPPLSQGSIEGGTVINSYLLHQDGKSDKLRRLGGSILFDEDIIGVIVKKHKLIDSDSALGKGGTLYEKSIDLGRGLEMSRGRDEIRISNNRRRLTFNFLTSDAMDEIRIITRATPVPTPGSVALIGMAGLFAFGRRRRA